MGEHIFSYELTDDKLVFLESISQDLHHYDKTVGNTDLLRII